MKRFVLLFLASLIHLHATAQETPAAPPGLDSATEKIPANIAVFPARLPFTLRAGESSTQAVTVRNTTKVKLQLGLQFMDWTRDTLGEHVFSKPGTMSQSCARWVSVDRPFVELGPGESATVRVTMSVPDSAEAVSEMKWTMLVVGTVSEKVAPNPNVKYETIVYRSLAMGVHIYQTPPNVTNKELKMLSFAPAPLKNTYRVACKNIGGVQLYGKFSLELSSTATGERISLDPQVVPMFPKQERYVDLTLPSTLPKGKYTAIALVDANDDEVPIEAAEKEIVVQ